jgi:hypothetical protein
MRLYGYVLKRAPADPRDKASGGQGLLAPGPPALRSFPDDDLCVVLTGCVGCAAEPIADAAA